MTGPGDSQVRDVPLIPGQTGLRDDQAKVQGLAGDGYSLGSTDDQWNRNWFPTTAPPDQVLARHMRYMLARSYDLHRNNQLVAGPSAVLAGLIGEITPEFLTSDLKERDELYAIWEEFAPLAGADGVTTWAQICDRMWGNAEQAGNVLASYDHRPDLEGPFPFKINLIDAQRLNYPSDRDKAGRRVVMGVAMDKGVHMGYYVENSEDPENPYYFERIRNGRPNARLFYRPDPLFRPGQVRATPIGVASMADIKDTWDFGRHTVRTVHSKARLKATMKAPNPQELAKIFAAARTADERGDHEEARALRQSARAIVAETPEAAILMLPSWAEYLETPKDTVGGGEFAEFVGEKTKTSVTGWGLPYEIGHRRWGDANFARARILMIQAGQEVSRWVRDAKDTFGRDVIKLLVQYAWAHGYLTKKPTKDTYKVQWRAAPNEYLDLNSEVDALSTAKATGIMSPQGIARRSNQDAMVVMREQLEFAKEFRDEAKRLELTEEDIAMALGKRTEAPRVQINQKDSNS